MKRTSLATRILTTVLITLAMAPSLAFAETSGTGTSPQPVAAAATAIPKTRWLGFFQPTSPSNMAPLVSTESMVGRQAGVINYFQSTEEGFTCDSVTNAVNHGAVPLVTLELFEASSMRGVANGSLDNYLKQYARDAAACGRPVWLRVFHEMNGNWYPWCGNVNGNTQADFIAAWRHVHDIFQAAGASNVKFVWCPNVESIPLRADNSISSYWPGAAYVDYIALDGYNFGPTDGLKWRSFEDIFDNAYDEVTALAPNTPVFVAETSSNEKGGDKGAWAAEMYDVIPRRFPRFIGVSWFNSKEKPYDFRVNSSSAALIGFGAGAANTTWSGQAVQVYRFYNKRNGSHFYTASVAERYKLQSKLSSTYRLEGTAYGVSTANAGNNDPLYRFYNKRNGSHFYTASVAERDRVAATLTSVYSYDGPAYNVCLTNKPGSTSVYRFFNLKNGSHFYTSSAAERDNVIANLPGNYGYEGVAFYLAP